MLVYPAGVAAALFYCWWLALAVFGLRLIVQGIVWNKSMKKLNEGDLWPWFLLLDIWLFFIPCFCSCLMEEACQNLELILSKTEQ